MFYFIIGFLMKHFKMQDILKNFHNISHHQRYFKKILISFCTGCFVLEPHQGHLAGNLRRYA